jgi:hypothetical protein
MAECMALAGPAITTTSLTSVLAFFSSSYLDMPGVSSFCICCSLAFFWDLILNVTMFPALVVLDESRIEYNGAWFWPWWHVHNSWDSEMTVTTLETRKGFEGYLQGASAKNLAGDARMSDLSLSTAETTSSGKMDFSHANFLHMKSTRKVVRTNSNSLSSESSKASKRKIIAATTKMKIHEIWWSVENLLVNYYAPILQLEQVQCLVLVIFTMMAVTGGGISFYNAKGLDADEFVMKGSNIWSFIKENERLYPTDYSLLSVTVGELDYTKRDEVTKLFDFFGYLESYEGTEGQVGGAGGNWYQHYAQYLNAKGKDVYIEVRRGGKAGRAMIYINTTNAALLSSLRSLLAVPELPRRLPRGNARAKVRARYLVYER